MTLLRSAPGDRLLLALASTAILLAAAAALGAWLLPGFYARDPAAVQPQMYGQDLVTLLAAPLLAAAVRLTARGSVRARIALLGGMLYLAYTYMTYAFGARFNAFFLAYVAILGCATYALAVGLARFPVEATRSARLPRRPLAAFLAAIPLLFGALWLVDIVGAYASGGIPAGAAEVQMPTSPIHVQDLAFVLPLSAAASVLLLRSSPWAPVLAGVVLAKAVAITLAMLAMGLMAWRAGQPVNLPVAGAAVVTLAVAVALGVPYVRGLAPRASPPRARHASAQGARP